MASMGVDTLIYIYKVEMYLWEFLKQAELNSFSRKKMKDKTMITDSSHTLYNIGGGMHHTLALVLKSINKAWLKILQF